MWHSHFHQVGYSREYCASIFFSGLVITRKNICSQTLALLFTRRIVLNVCYVFVSQTTLGKNNMRDMNSLYCMLIDASFIYEKNYLSLLTLAITFSLLLGWGQVYYSVRISRRKHLCDLRGDPAYTIMKIKAIIKYWITFRTTCIPVCGNTTEYGSAKLHFYEDVGTVDNIIVFHLIFGVVGYGKWTLSLSSRNIFSNAIRSICYTAAVSSRWNEIGAATSVLRRPISILLSLSDNIY